MIVQIGVTLGLLGASFRASAEIAAKRDCQRMDVAAAFACTASPIQILYYKYIKTRVRAAIGNIIWRNAARTRARGAM